MSSVAARSRQTGPRVAVVDAYPGVFAGSLRVAVDVCDAIARLGGAATVVLPGDGPAAEALAGRCAVRVLSAPPSLRHYGDTTRGRVALRAALSLPLWWLRLALFLRAYDVVWADDLRGVLLAGVPARLLRRPIVWHVHNPGPRPGSFARVAERLATVVVACHPSAARAGGVRGPVVDLPNSVTLPPEVVDTSDGGVLTVARTHPDKGLDTAIAAAEQLAVLAPDVPWVVVGGPSPGFDDYAESLRSAANALHFEPADPDVRRAVGRCAVYVQPSRAEWLSIAVLEAMSAARPVVVTNLPALADLVDHGAAGVLVPVEDPTALAAAIAALLADPARAAELGRAARARVEQVYSPEAFRTGVRQVLAGLGALAS